MERQCMNNLEKGPEQIEKKTSQFKEVCWRLLRNKAAIVGFLILIVFIVFALFPGYIASYGYDDQLLSRRFKSPSREFLMGTDNFGRDIFSRVVYGSRTSLLVGIISTAIGAILGSFFGALAGFYGRGVDNVIMRIVDVLMAIPSILLALSIAAALGPGLFNVMLAVGIGAIPRFARTVHASVLTLKDQEFVEAARAIGGSDFRIIFRHIFPNCIAPIIVQATIGVAMSITNAASLSFIGLGVQPPIPEWGAMLSAGRQYIRDYWYIVTFPGVAIMLTIFSLNLFGDGLRDALDPKLKH